MTTLIPRLFGDLVDLFGPEPARLGTFIRIEDRLTDTEYVLRAELPGVDPEKDIEVTVHDGEPAVTVPLTEPETGRTIAITKGG
jgi:HSP20 family molecular chaperone IbpA